MMLSAKYQEIYPPEVNSYSTKDLQTMIMVDNYPFERPSFSVLDLDLNVCRLRIG
jgi:hypothetical protein